MALVEVIGPGRELVGIDELLGWDAWLGEGDLVQIEELWLRVDAWQAQSRCHPAEEHVAGDGSVAC